MDEKRIEKDFLTARPPLAYAKLKGMINDDEPYEAVITQLPVDLGRGPKVGQAPSRIGLGDLMSVSRHHATIDWNTEKGVFELKCVGKNGMYASGKKIEKDQIVTLVPKMPLRIGGARVYFLPAIKPLTGVMTGYKLIQKVRSRPASPLTNAQAFEKANPSKTVGLTIEETVDAIYTWHAKIIASAFHTDPVASKKSITKWAAERTSQVSSSRRYPWASRLTSLRRAYFESANPNFKRVSISPAGEPRYIWTRPEGADEAKKRPGTSASDSKKKQKVNESPAVPAEQA
ncbi:hypothetical protein ACHHYP_00878 [Achlya hypogyna]|uniref:FHA domain-containing protein n=1 Tax=Achlya hypogyna TaxID=1202772 RepID=A0A1V9ZA65_ACHHY|nr:hypothetical protein ACHHYP_00878 [Achlya hypogyna]